MKDVQNETPSNEVPINQVGINHVRYPISVKTKSGKNQNTIANIELTVGLSGKQRGTHMSRFIELLEDYKDNINSDVVDDILCNMLHRFDAPLSFLTMTFPYFITVKAPVSDMESTFEATCGFIGKSHGQTTLYVKMPVTTLCPCSKEISKYGAHNQRAYVTVQITPVDFIWFEDIIESINSCASSPIYPLLKRRDEKYVTEKAYENPRFVEDLVRAIFVKLSEYRIENISIEVESDESIHTHRAVAKITRGF